MQQRKNAFKYNAMKNYEMHTNAEKCSREKSTRIPGKIHTNPL
jgi:hypothetical protein